MESRDEALLGARIAGTEFVASRSKPGHHRDADQREEEEAGVRCRSLAWSPSGSYPVELVASCEEDRGGQDHVPRATGSQEVSATRPVGRPSGAAPIISGTTESANGRRMPQVIISIIIVPAMPMSVRNCSG